MNPTLRDAAESLVRRAELAGVRGATADAARLPDAVPGWYREMLTAVPLAGLRLGLPGADGGGRWLEVCDEWAVRREPEPAPGFVTFARCAEGGGDRYALATGAGTDPPVVRFATVDGRPEPVCARLSDLLRWAPVLVWDEGRGE